MSEEERNKEYIFPPVFYLDFNVRDAAVGKKGGRAVRRGGRNESTFINRKKKQEMHS